MTLQVNSMNLPIQRNLHHKPWHRYVQTDYHLTSQYKTKQQNCYEGRRVTNMMSQNLRDLKDFSNAMKSHEVISEIIT